MQYNILTHKHIPTLIKQVNEAMDRGWEVTGGLTSIRHPNESLFLQAMIRTDIERDIHK